MAQADFEAAILGVESGAGATREMDQITFYSQFLAALGVRIAANTAGSPAVRKMEAIRQRVIERQSEVSAKGAGLI